MIPPDLLLDIFLATMYSLSLPVNELCFSHFVIKNV
jgi:hypothetical protein